MQLLLFSQETIIEKINGDYYTSIANDDFNNELYDLAKDNYLLASKAYLEEKEYSKAVKILSYISYIYYNINNDVIGYRSSTQRTFELAKEYLTPTDNNYIRALEELSTSYYSTADYKKSLN